MEPRIGLTAEQRTQCANRLNRLLSDEFVLYTKTLNFHWNVYGMQFNDLHLFFKGQYEELFIVIDDVAERVRSLGHISYGTLGQFSRTTKLTEDQKIPSDRDMLSALLTDHETIICLLRADITAAEEEYHDKGTGNFLTDLMEKHEKMAWMLRAYLTR